VNVVDSFAFVEYFRNGPNAKVFATAIENTVELIVPSICVYEVFKKFRVELDLEAAEEAVSHTQPLN
jgi:hypothetical protein